MSPLGLGLITDWTGTHRVGKASTRYTLTDEARRAFDAEVVAEVEEAVA